jgi:hypothetical protein
MVGKLEQASAKSRIGERAMAMAMEMEMGGEAQLEEEPITGIKTLNGAKKARIVGELRRRRGREREREGAGRRRKHWLTIARYPCDISCSAACVQISASALF